MNEENNIVGTLHVNGTIHGTIQISGGSEPVLQEVTVTPRRSAFVVEPSEGYDGISKVNVNATSLQLGVIAYPNEEGFVVEPEQGYVGLRRVSVAPCPLQDKTVTPGATIQTVIADSEYYGLGTVTVNATSALYDFVLSSDMQTQIPDYMFKDQVNLRSFKTSKNNSYSMGSQVFDSCTNLERVEMPYLTGIGLDAFYGCNNIKDYYFGYKSRGLPADSSQVPNLPSSNTLRGSSTMKIHVPADMETYYKAATNWSNYASRIVGDYVI